MRHAAIIATFLLSLSSMTVHAQQQKSNTYINPTNVQPAGGGEQARSDNYLLNDTIGEQGIGDAGSTNYDLNAGYRQAVGTTISISGPTSVTLGTITAYGQATASGTWIVRTDASGGYQLDWRAGTAAMTSGANTIDAFVPAVANTPDTWSVAASATAWGGRLSSTSTDTAAEWGTDSVSEKWLNVRTTARTIVTRGSATPAGGSNEAVQFRVEAGSSTSLGAGTYSVTITMTATAL